ncbi:hypothetical protein SCLCIDRAFT_131100 [Scleroderma citrinum Foug A]|uniref:Protein kinase domain-containing protein n=1 Tax=Scleroderma citrinum Foug A TaxID=1036808 RepID=A0A0C3DLK6_9AGAM|nr:hypothetical protein SCLCIDRAFT_131100 [Scleroderma citrinum Foug A]
MRQHSQSPWACQKGLSIMPHTHYWLILDLVREALTSFSSSKELVQAIHDALVAHRAVYAAGFLHWDLSPGNIIIVDGCGYLINWDFAKATKNDAPHWITRTGTWPFMSANLVEDASAVHTFQDDLESSFWLLLWATFMFMPLSLSLVDCTKFI